MASLFRASRTADDRGAGGKLLRGSRRDAPRASPYARPSSSALPLPPAPTESHSPRWLLGLISGAGKLISAVFRSDSEESSQPTSEHSGYSSDGAISDSSKEDEDTSAKFQENDELNQISSKPDLTRDSMELALALVPESDTKSAIEQLLTQATFSRDECNKLTQMIQSRVVDFPSSGIDDTERQRYLPYKTVGSPTSFPGATRSTDRYMKLTEGSPYFTNDLNTLSPGSPFQSRTPDLHDKAVMEAKKYLEEKRLESSSKSCLDCGPCTLNTDMLHYDIGSEVDSPMDMAKSYMKSLPPWRSPSLSSAGFKTPSPSGMHLQNETIKYSLPSLKALKRSCLAVASHEDLDETRRVRLKPTDDILVYSKKFRQVDSTTRFSEHTTSKFYSAFDKKFCDEDHLGVVTHQVETDKGPHIDILSDPEEAVQDVKCTHEAREPSPDKGCEPHPSDADVFIFDKNQKNVKDHSQNKEQSGVISDHHGTLVQASRSSKHAGNQLSEAKVMQSEDQKSISQSDRDDVTNHATNMSPGNGGLLTTNNSSHLNKDRQFIDDSMLQDEVSQPNGSTNKIIANGSLEMNTNLHCASLKKGVGDATNSSHSGTVVGNAEGSCELDKEATGNVLTNHGDDGLTDKVQNGTRMGSIECMISETQSSTTRRGKKHVVRSRRGRGKLK